MDTPGTHPVDNSASNPYEGPRGSVADTRTYPETPGPAQQPPNNITPPTPNPFVSTPGYGMNSQQVYASLNSVSYPSPITPSIGQNQIYTGYQDFPSAPKRARNDLDDFITGMPQNLQALVPQIRSDVLADVQRLIAPTLHRLNETEHRNQELVRKVLEQDQVLAQIQSTIARLEADRAKDAADAAAAGVAAAAAAVAAAPTTVSPASSFGGPVVQGPETPLEAAVSFFRPRTRTPS